MDYSPRIVTLELTNACNLRCKHCYACAGEALENELSTEEIEKVLRELYDLGTFEIELSGGEPLLRPDFMKIVSIAQSLDFEVTILSNGVLIDKKIAKKLKDYSLKHVQVSVEGLSNNHEYIRGKGTFKSTINGIRYLRAEGIPVAMRTTATKRSLNDIESIFALAVDLDIYRFGVLRFFPVGRGMAYKNELMLNANEIVILQNIINNIRKTNKTKMGLNIDYHGLFELASSEGRNSSGVMLCPGGKTWCIIKSNGIVSSCDLLPTYAGNVREESLANIWDDAPIFKTFRELDPKKLKGACELCDKRDVCLGYCRALALIYTADFYAEDPTCFHSITKKRLT